MKFDYDELKNKTLKFYESISIEVPINKLECAVQSLTMSQFAKEYNVVNEKEIYDNRVLATLGDAICGAFVIKKEFKNDISADDLTKKKKVVTNKNLNKIGKELLEGKIFFSNTDIDEKNTKAYATAFEAIVGFISLISIKDAFKFLELKLK